VGDLVVYVLLVWLMSAICGGILAAVFGTKGKPLVVAALFLGTLAASMLILPYCTERLKHLPVSLLFFMEPML
jgi:hypothetical protein